MDGGSDVGPSTVELQDSTPAEQNAATASEIIDLRGARFVDFPSFNQM
jgi:hypothetical protein